MRLRRFWRTHQLNCGYFRGDFNVYERACYLSSSFLSSREFNTILPSNPILQLNLSSLNQICLVITARADTRSTIHRQIGCMVTWNFLDRTRPRPFSIFRVDFR